MAGGTFTAMNKVRPGAYINFVSVPRPMMTVGDRGIGTFGMALDWGADDELIDVYSTDMLDGKSLAKVGVTAFDSGAKLLNLMLSNCYMAKIYRLNTGGAWATATLGSLTTRAKYTGKFGNNITVSISAEGSLFVVSTFVRGTLVDKQKVLTISELENNDFVIFSGTGALVATASKPLTGGTSDSISPSTAYPAYFALAKMARWQTMAITQDGTIVNPLVKTFIENLRNDEGRYVQAVVANYDGADSEGVINNINGARIEGVNVTAAEMTAWVAGATAGATIVQSNTGRVVTGATQIIGELDNAGIIDALNAGKFVLSTNQRGEIIVEQDINSLHTFTATKNNAFRKNRIIRTLDEIGTTIGDIWEQSYKGKVNNNEDGRAVFKGDVVAYFNTLQDMGAIQEFAGADDVEVTMGADLDVVVCNVFVRPVDSMEKLYMTVNVIG